jgi:hypothetical protein
MRLMRTNRPGVQRCGINPKQTTPAECVHRRQGSAIVSCRLVLLSLEAGVGHVTSIANSTYGGML